ncbi:MAG: DNA polymerase III subunit delta' [Luteibaculum sp.]
MKFSESIGLENRAKKLSENVSQGRIAHAQMFEGEDGSGILHLALAYISYIFCSNKEGQDACGSCPSCQKMKSLNHPDVHWIFPMSLSDAKGKPPKEVQMGEAQKIWRETLLKNPYLSYFEWLEALGEEKKRLEINKYAAEYLFKKMALKSYEGGMKVAVIWKPELMNTSAANTLLKIIEEPPAKTLFLLLSEQSDAVLTTIRSRTQISRVPRPEAQELASWLAERINMNTDVANSIAFAAQGNIGRALKMARELGSENELFVMFRAWMRICFSRDLEALRQWIAENSKQSRDVLSGLLQYGLQVIFSALKVHLGQDHPKSVNPVEVEFIGKFAPFVDRDRATKYHTLFNEAIADIMWNGNAKIILGDLSFNFMMLLHQKKKD